MTNNNKRFIISIKIRKGKPKGLKVKKIMNKTTLAYFTIEDNYFVFTRTNYFDDNTKSIERAKAEKELARLQAINTNRHLKIVTRYDVITM